MLFTFSCSTLFDYSPKSEHFSAKLTAALIHCYFNHKEIINWVKIISSIYLMLNFRALCLWLNRYPNGVHMDANFKLRSSKQA